MLKVGFIGVGRISDMHYEGYKNNPNATLYAICDTNKDILNKRKNEWKIKHTYENYKQLINDPNIDAVEIMAPHHLHHKIVIDALNAEKHVSVQKPMALNISQANEMIEIANNKEKLLRVIDNYRYHPPFSKVKSLITKGAIGEPISIRLKSLTGNAKFGWPIPSSAQTWRSNPILAGKGSIIFDHGQHIWSIARYLMGEVESVFTFTGSQKVDAFHEMVPGSLMDNPIMVNWKYKDKNKFGNWESIYSDKMIVNSKYYPIYVWGEITGSNGILWVNNFIGHKLNRAPLELYSNGEMKSYDNINSDYKTGFQKAGYDFTNAIIKKRKSELTAEEGREVLRLSLAVIKSAKDNKEIYVNKITN